jgi:hypothetical protein
VEASINMKKIVAEFYQYVARIAIGARHKVSRLFLGIGNDACAELTRGFEQPRFAEHVGTAGLGLTEQPSRFAPHFRQQCIAETHHGAGLTDAALANKSHAVEQLVKIFRYDEDLTAQGEAPQTGQSLFQDVEQMDDVAIVGEDILSRRRRHDVIVFVRFVIGMIWRIAQKLQRHLPTRGKRVADEGMVLRDWEIAKVAWRCACFWPTTGPCLHRYTAHTERATNEFILLLSYRRRLEREVALQPSIEFDAIHGLRDF